MKLSNKQLSRMFSTLTEVLSSLEKREKKLCGVERKSGGLIYARVSTGDQAKGYSPDFQKSESLKRLEELGVPFIDKAFFYDEGVSGRKIHRENFSLALKFAIENAETVSHFMVYCSDRYARKAITAGLSRMFLKGLGIKVCSVVDRMEDLTEVELVKREAENEDYATQGVKRTKDGMRKARIEGRHTSLPPYGYTNGPPQLIDDEYKRMIIFDPELEEYARLVLTLALSGKPQHLIRDEAASSGAPMRFKRQSKIDIHTVHRILKNRFYAGQIQVESDVWAKGIHEPMISMNDFWKIQTLHGFNSSSQAVPHISDRDELPLRRFLRCEKCGYGITGSQTTNSCGEKYNYYRCQRGCSKSIPTDKLHDRFSAELWRIAPKKEVSMLLRKALQDLLKKKTTHYFEEKKRVETRLEKEKFNLVQASSNLSSGILDKQAFIIVQKSLLRFINTLEARLIKLENLDGISDDLVQKALDVICKAPTIWPTLNLESKHLLQTAIFPDGIAMTHAGELVARPTPLSRINELLRLTDKRIQSPSMGKTCNRKIHTLSGMDSNKIQVSAKNRKCSSVEHEFSPLATPNVIAASEDSIGAGRDDNTWRP